MKYYIITYGCQMNFSDSERIATILEKIGYSPTLKIEKADLIVVNMCSVRQSAVDRVYGNIKNFDKLKKKNKKLKVVLTGCILKSDLRKFREKFDYISRRSRENQGSAEQSEAGSYILSIKSLSRWKKFLRKDEFLHYPKQNRDPLSVKLQRAGLCKLDCPYLKIKPKYTTKFSAYVPIIIGCNNFCSYCVVPYTRGPEISRPAEDILDEVKSLVKREYKEIWLLGENVNSYKSQIQIIPNYSKSNPKSKIQKFKLVNFSTLLKMVNNIPGNFWLRFTSSHPKDFSDELIKTIAECEKITKYISLPIQSGDDKILKKMNRPYTVAQYKNLVKKIRRKIPNVTLSTDVIVGFPRETKKQFENTVKLFKEIKPDMAYIAQYSPRPGTTAFKMKDNISHQEKEKRDKVLTEVLKKTALENNKKYIGKIVEVLPEYERKNWLIGKTKEYKTIKFQVSRVKSQNLIGKFVRVKVVDVIPWGLKGKLVK